MTANPLEVCLDALLNRYPHRPLHELSDSTAIMEGVINAGGSVDGALEAAGLALDTWEQERRERAQNAENAQRLLSYVRRRAPQLQYLPQLRHYMAHHFYLQGGALTVAVRKAAIVLRNGGSPGAALYHAVNLQEMT